MTLPFLVREVCWGEKGKQGGVNTEMKESKDDEFHSKCIALGKLPIHTYIKSL